MPSTSSVRLLTRAAVGLALALAVAVVPRAARAQDLAPPTAATSAPSGGSASASPRRRQLRRRGRLGRLGAELQRRQRDPVVLLRQAGERGSRPSSSNRGSTTSSATESPSAASSASSIRRGATDREFRRARRVQSGPQPSTSASGRPSAIDGSYTHNTGSSSTAALEVFAPFLYHVAPHFFLGAGPFLSYLVKGGPDTQYGLDFVIGGWL